jgi:hypothetical protein
LGACSIGVGFHLWRALPFHNAIWHSFVLAGDSCHYAAILDGVVLATVDRLLHGTTIGTNAVLEYDGAMTGMITTAGYRDIVHIGRSTRSNRGR